MALDHWMQYRLAEHPGKVQGVNKKSILRRVANASHSITPFAASARLSHEKKSKCKRAENLLWRCLREGQSLLQGILNILAAWLPCSLVQVISCPLATTLCGKKKKHWPHGTDGLSPLPTRKRSCAVR